jgi:hypothetical protein
MIDLDARLDAIRKRASDGGMPVRRKDRQLYGVLADCLTLCEDVEREGLLPELRRAVRVSVDIRGQGNAGKGRRYVETGSDVFILVSRFALEGHDNRNSFYRYASTLREAAKRQIRGADLEEWLSSNGGVKALYLSRPVVTKSYCLRTIHLRDSIEYPRNRSFTITLRWDGQGAFFVEKSGVDI